MLFWEFMSSIVIHPGQQDGWGQEMKIEINFNMVNYFLWIFKKAKRIQQVDNLTNRFIIQSLFFFNFFYHQNFSLIFSFSFKSIIKYSSQKNIQDVSSWCNPKIWTFFNTFYCRKKIFTQAIKKWKLLWRKMYRLSQLKFKQIKRCCEKQRR